MYRRSAISICLVALMLTPLPALAAMSASDSGRLDQYEQSIFGSQRRQLSEESRLRALEINLFGKSKTGAHEARLSAIAKIMGTPSTAKYLPPMAGSVDAIAAAAPVKPKSTKPSASELTKYAVDDDSGYGNVSTSAAPAQSDQIKDILRQALEKHSQGDSNTAERLFKQALSINPRNADANFNLAAMLEDKGDLNGALHYYDAAAKASPADHDIQDAIAGTRDKIRQNQVAQQTQSDMAKKVQLKQVADSAAAAYKAGKYDQAIADLDQIAAQTPNDANVQYGLGQAWRGKGDLSRARQFLTRAASLSPNNQLYRTTLADLSRDSQRQVAKGGNAGNGNAPSPDYAANGGMPGPRNNNGVQDYDNSDIASGAGDNFNSGNGGNGGVQPFTSQGEGRLYGHEVANGIRSGGIGGIGGIGGMGGLGMGAIGALGGLGLNRAMGGGARYGGSGSRLMRGAVTGAMSGAAIGALTNMHGSGGVKAGAMRGALYGGLFGLMSGF